MFSISSRFHHSVFCPTHPSCPALHQKSLPASVVKVHWSSFVGFDVTEVVYAWWMDISITCKTEFVEVRMLNTQRRKLVKHTDSFDNVISNIHCIVLVSVRIFLAVACTGVYVVSSFIRRGVRMLHTEDLRIFIFASSLNIILENKFFKLWIFVPGMSVLITWLTLGGLLSISLDCVMRKKIQWDYRSPLFWDSITSTNGTVFPNGSLSPTLRSSTYILSWRTLAHISDLSEATCLRNTSSDVSFHFRLQVIFKEIS